jgi:hypothetical protein
MSLYHYTCDHGHALLGSGSAVLVPGQEQTDKQVPWPGRLVWLTDLDKPVRDALGLTSHILACDRTRHRYRVTNPDRTVRWVTVARNYPRDEIEAELGARPMHWWVSPGPVPVVYDPLARERATP